MPSPFPGMDPYLEAAEIFPDLHDSLITHCKEALMARLPKPYYAISAARVWIESTGRLLGPDVRIHRGNGRRNGPVASAKVKTATLTPRLSEPIVVQLVHDEIRETRVEIYAKEGNKRRLVTTIEILSPTNKKPGEKGRDLYLQKQEELLHGNINLIEIDLLRGGKPTTAVHRGDTQPDTGKFDYHICCHRFERPYDYFVYPIQLEAALPVIAVPLLPGVPDVALPLQSLFDHVYDAGPYVRLVDYRELIPDPPLGPAKAKWVKKRLAAAGLLKRK